MRHTSFASLVALLPTVVACGLIAPGPESVSPAPGEDPAVAPPDAVSTPPAASSDAGPPPPPPPPPPPASLPTLGSGATAIGVDAVHVYFAWSDESSGDTEQLARVPKQGGVVEPLFSRPAQWGAERTLVLTDDAVFLATYGADLLRIGKDGSAPVSLGPVSWGVMRIPIAATRADAYWIDSAGDLMRAGSAGVASKVPAMADVSVPRRQVAAVAADEVAAYVVTTDAVGGSWRARVERVAVGEASRTRMIDGRAGVPLMTVWAGNVTLLWGLIVDRLDAPSLAKATEAPLTSFGIDTGVANVVGSRTGLVVLAHQSPDPFGKMSGLEVKLGAEGVGATSLADGASERTGTDLATDGDAVYFAKRTGAPGSSPPAVLTRLALP